MDVTIRPAGPADTGRANAALAALSRDLGDAHAATEAGLAAALFAPYPVAFALLATAQGQTAAVGIAMVSPVYSTTRGAAGLFVSDLWVARGHRGTGLGRRLLVAARDLGTVMWGAAFLSLAVYATAPGSVAFYRRLGFTEATGTHHLTLEAGALDMLGDPR